MPPPGSIPIEQELVAVIHGLVGELQPERTTADIPLSSRLERDLGIDSLAPTELI
jgi:acyl carrier protein